MVRVRPLTVTTRTGETAWWPDERGVPTSIVLLEVTGAGRREGDLGSSLRCWPCGSMERLSPRRCRRRETAWCHPLSACQELVGFGEAGFVEAVAIATGPGWWKVSSIIRLMQAPDGGNGPWVIPHSADAA